MRSGVVPRSSWREVVVSESWCLVLVSSSPVLPREVLITFDFRYRSKKRYRSAITSALNVTGQNQKFSKSNVIGTNDIGKSRSDYVHSYYVRVRKRSDFERSKLANQVLWLLE